MGFDYKMYAPSLTEEEYMRIKQLDDKYLNNFDPEDDTTNFTEQDYANLQRNLVLFKEGNREATDYLIAAFYRILRAYAGFISLHQLPYRKYYDPKHDHTGYKVHPSVLSFIRLFGGKINDDKYELKKNTKVFRESCEYIYKLFAKYNYLEIFNELVLALLNMANKYKIISDPNDYRYKPNGTFHIYVKKCFHFEAFYYLKQLIKDPLINFNLLSLSDEDENDYDNDNNIVNNSVVLVDEEALSKFDAIIDTVDRQIQLQNSPIALREDDDIDVRDMESLNFNWIVGNTCGPLFKTLTPYEREILVLSYVKHQTEDTLAALFHCSRATIGSHKRRAIEKIKKAKENQ